MTRTSPVPDNDIKKRTQVNKYKYYSFLLNIYEIGIETAKDNEETFTEVRN